MVIVFQIPREILVKTWDSPVKVYYLLFVCVCTWSQTIIYGIQFFRRKKGNFGTGTCLFPTRIMGSSCLVSFVNVLSHKQITSQFRILIPSQRRMLPSVRLAQYFNVLKIMCHGGVSKFWRHIFHGGCSTRRLWGARQKRNQVTTRTKKGHGPRASVGNGPPPTSFTSTFTSSQTRREKRSKTFRGRDREFAFIVIPGPNQPEPYVFSRSHSSYWSSTHLHSD